MAKKAAPKGGKSKRRVSGKRGTAGRRKQSTVGVDVRGVAGIVILCLGLLSLFSQFLPSGGGFLNQCTLIARGLGGTLCLLLPIVLCAAGVVLVFFANRNVNVRTMVCVGLIFLLVETLLQLFEVNSISTSILTDGKAVTYGSFLARSYKNASLNCRGGGLIGALLAWPLCSALSVWGAVIVLIFAFTIVLMVFTGVSFGNVGMVISTWVDEWRVAYAERREERQALRAAQEEAELEHESEMAEQRQQRRVERARSQAEKKAQLEAKEAVEVARALRHAQTDVPQSDPEFDSVFDQAYGVKEDEQDAQNAPAQEPPKRKPKLEVVRPKEADEKLPLMPPLDERPMSRTSTAPVRPVRSRMQRRTISENTPLYIERDDEFTRAGIDERRDVQERRRRARFTIQEAEDAFLHGMNATPSGAGTGGPERSGYAQSAPVAPVAPVAPSASVVPAAPAAAAAVSAAAVSAVAADAYAANGSATSGNVPNARAVYGGMMDRSAQNDSAPDDSALNDGAPYENDMEDELPWGSEKDDAPGDEDAYAALEDPENGVAWRDMPDARIDAQTDEMRAGPSAQEAYSRPSSIPARPSWGAQADARPAAQAINPFSAQAAAQDAQPQDDADKTIVQLRGNRLDGTPIVMPAKDTHNDQVQVVREPYAYPPLDLLNRTSTTQDPNQRAKDEAGARKLLATLESFGVQAKLTHVTHGPAITRYEVQPGPGVKVSRIVNLVDDIALNMASDGVRIEAPIPGKPAVGIEIPNEKIEMVSLRDVLESQEMTREKSPTAVALGKGISGTPVVADMAKMPHVLIAGATGSGKSVCINTIINSIIYRASPQEVRLILIDPKVVELSVYNGIPHLLIPVVTDPKKASAALSWAVVEMEHRYKRFESMGVRDIRGYNNAIGPNEEPMSKIIVIIDELADLMMVAPGEVEESICRLAQLARAAGIHLVIATQRPSVNVITGVIKANIPSRIAFAVSSQIDSRTILDAGGAEKLLGKGDMLYAPQGAGKPTRVQGCFVSDDEVQRIVEYVRCKHSAEYDEDVMEQMNNAVEEDKAAAGDAPTSGEPVDEMLNKAIDLAVEAGQVSISMLQRRLRVGYARAGRLVDEMTLRGITAEAEGPTKPRAVLISREEWRRMQENQE